MSGIVKSHDRHPSLDKIWYTMVYSSIPLYLLYFSQNMTHSMRTLTRAILTAALGISLAFSPVMANAAVVKPAGRKLPVKIVRKAVKPKALAAKAGIVSKLPGSPIIFGPNPVINVPTLASPTAPIKAVPTGRVFAKAVDNNQSIVLAGDDVMVISNTNFVQNQNIILRDRAELIIKDSAFTQNSSGPGVRYLEARDYSQIKISNSDLRFSPGTNWRITDHASLNITGSSVAADATSGIVWHEITKDAKVEIFGAPFHASITDRANISIDRSPDVFLDLDLNGAIVDQEFPRVLTDFNFPAFGGHNVYFKVHITNSVAYRWGIKTSPMSNVTVRNTDGLNVGLVFGWPLENATIALDGLQLAHYDDRLITARQMKLRLINTTVSEWIPVAGDSNTLQISNANLSAQQWDWGWANVSLSNCVIPAARAKQNVTMTLKDCSVNGDVTAADDSKITLVNSTIAGKKILKGNGQIKEQ